MPQNRNTVDDRYFSCPEQHGLFVRPANVTLVQASPRLNVDVSVEGKALLTRGVVDSFLADENTPGTGGGIGDVGDGDGLVVGTTRERG